MVNGRLDNSLFSKIAKYHPKKERDVRTKLALPTGEITGQVPPNRIVYLA